MNRFSVPHDRLFLDALERDLKREKGGQEPTTTVAGEPARSFRLVFARHMPIAAPWKIFILTLISLFFVPFEPDTIPNEACTSSSLERTEDSKQLPHTLLGSLSLPTT